MVGQTGCGKTTFAQNLAKNRVFGDIKVIYWLSKISMCALTFLKKKRKN